VVELATKASKATIGWDQLSDHSAEFDLIVNATPLGMSGHDRMPGLPMREGQAVVDLIYDPPETALVEAAKQAGGAGWGGLGMLVHQAAASLRIWTGQEAPIEAMSVAALHALSRR
jgi:shikimate dehydrogenase